MEKPIIRISVRNLVEFILRSGDLTSGGTTAADKEAMLKGSRLHRKIQKQMGSTYQAEVPLKKESEYEDLILYVEGRADGIFSEGETICIDEIKEVWTVWKNRWKCIGHRHFVMAGSIWRCMSWRVSIFR